MQEWVDNYWMGEGIHGKDEGNRDVVSAHFLETQDKCIFSIDISPQNDKHTNYPSRNEDAEALNQVHLLQAQINSLRDTQVLAFQKRGRMQFDGVKLPKRMGLNPPRSNKSLPQNSPSQNPPPNNGFPPSLPRPTIHSHPRPRDCLPQQPQGLMKPIDMPPKPTNNPKFWYQLAIKTSIKPSDLVNHALDARITISTRKLLATSPEVQKQVKELVSSRKVVANLVEENALNSYLSSCFDPDPSSAFLEVEKYNDLSPSAVQSLPL